MTTDTDGKTATEQRPTVADYDPIDSWDSPRGLTKCAHCGQTWSMNSGSYGPVVTHDGREFEWYVETDADDEPLFCPDCYTELETNRKRQENHTLDSGRWVG